MAATLLTAAVLTAALVSPAFDKVLLKDGRLIEGTLTESPEAGYTAIAIGGMVVPIRDELVERTYVENLEDYVPKDDKEREYLAKGFVLFEDKWMARTRREQILRKRAEEQDRLIDEARDRQDWRNATVRNTRRFTIKSNCTDEVIDEYVTRLDLYYKNFTRSWGITLNPGDADKPKLFLYRNYEDFLKITRSRRGVGGFYNFVDNELHLYNDHLDPESTLDTLFHEGNHLLTHLIDLNFMYPMWMNEGMAEYYGTARIDEKGRFHVGELQYGRIVSLQHDERMGQTLTLEDVCLAEQREYGVRHYAAGWSFVHFLMESKDYEKRFKGFFRTLPDNRDVKIENVPFQGATKAYPDYETVLVALEKKLGTSREELESEWMAWRQQAYGELPPEAWYLAARLNLRQPDPEAEDDAEDDHVERAFEYYEKAVQGGIRNANCYRQYAELLRKGGVTDGPVVYLPREADPVRALAMIEQAIELDPLNAYNYTEAGGVLLLKGPTLDLDRAEAMMATARALAPGDTTNQSLRRELTKKIEESREWLASQTAAATQGSWTIQPYYYEGEEVPERIPGLTLAELRERIDAGEIGLEDWAFNGTPARDPTTGEPGEPQPWEKDWVQLKDIPLFADEVAQDGADDQG